MGSSIYKLPIIGWLIGLATTASLSVPFYFAWNHVAPKYLPMIPTVYQQVGFVDILCIFISFIILKDLALKGIVNIRSSSTSNCKDK